MFKFSLSLCMLVLTTSSALAQDPTGDDVTPEKFGAVFQRVMSMVEIVTSESEMEENLELEEEGKNSGAQFQGAEMQISKLELMDYQREDVQKFAKAFTKFSDQIDQSPDARTLNRMFKEVSALEKHLLQEILIPNQAQVLNGRVFARHLTYNNGNYLQTIANVYPDKVTLDEEQVKKVKEISSKAREKKTAATLEYRKELKKIAEETNTKLKHIFSGKAIDTFGEAAVE